MAVQAVACGESSLGYTWVPVFMAASFAVACGESSLGYTKPAALITGLPSCGLRGIVARIH